MTTTTKKLTAAERDLLAAQDYIRKTFRERKPVADELIRELGKRRMLGASNTSYKGTATSKNGRYDFMISFRQIIHRGDARVECFASLKVRNVPGNGKTPDSAVMQAKDNARKFLAEGLRSAKHPLNKAFLERAKLKVLKGVVSMKEYPELKDQFRKQAGLQLRAAEPNARATILAQFSPV